MRLPLLLLLVLLVVLLLLLVRQPLKLFGSVASRLCMMTVPSGVWA